MLNFPSIMQALKRYFECKAYHFVTNIKKCTICYTFCYKVVTKLYKNIYYFEKHITVKSSTNLFFHSVFQSSLPFSNTRANTMLWLYRTTQLGSPMKETRKTVFLVLLLQFQLPHSYYFTTCILVLKFVNKGVFF